MDGSACGSVPRRCRRILPSRHRPRRRYGVSVSVRRVCIRCDGGAADVVLPAHVPVAELLPAIVELVDGRPTDDGAPRHWRLDRPAGSPLKECSSLRENGIHDGDLLILDAADAPRLGAVRTEPCQRAITARPPTAAPTRVPADCACVLATALAAAGLASTAGSDRAATHAIIAAAGAAVALGLATRTNHPTTVCLSAVALSAATGFLAVPSSPATPNVFLAAAAALTASLLTLRLSARPSPAVTSIAAVALPTALATLLPVPAAVVGATLATASLALLALAPRLSVATAGLLADDPTPNSADAAHATLTGLVAGSAAGGAAGTVVVAIAEPTVPAVALSAVVGAALVLRARTYVDAPRRIALAATGFIAIGVGVLDLCVARAEFVGPAAGVLIAIGLVSARRPTIGAAVARTLDRLEYAALAAVAPVAVWVGGWHPL